MLASHTNYKAGFRAVTLWVSHPSAMLCISWLIWGHISSFTLLWSESRAVVSNSLRPHGLYCPWNSPGQITVVGSLSLLQRIFPIQGSNPGLPHCRQILYQLSHKGSPTILGGLQFTAGILLLWKDTLKEIHKTSPPPTPFPQINLKSG